MKILRHFLLECTGLSDIRKRNLTLQQPYNEDEDEVIMMFLFEEDRRKMEERKTDLYSMWKLRKRKQRELNTTQKCTTTKVVKSIKVVRSHCKGISSKSLHRITSHRSGFKRKFSETSKIEFKDFSLENIKTVRQRAKKVRGKINWNYKYNPKTTLCH